MRQPQPRPYRPVVYASRAHRRRRALRAALAAVAAMIWTVGWMVVFDLAGSDSPRPRGEVVTPSPYGWPTP